MMRVELNLPAMLSDEEFQARLAKLRHHPFPVLDDGHVMLIDVMGQDQDIVEAARISYGKGTRRGQEDAHLLRYLLRLRHTTPFEMCLAGDTQIPTYPCRGAQVKTYSLQQLAEAFEKGGRASAWVKLLRIRTVNPTTGVVTATRIKRAWQTGRRAAYRVEVASPFRRSIVVTDNHPFLLPSGRYASLQELQVGDQVMLNGVPATPADVIAEIQRRRAARQPIKEVAAALGVSSTTVHKYSPGRVPRRTGFLKKAVGQHRDPRAIARRKTPHGCCAVPGCDQPGRDVHHQDENPHNNVPENLLRLCPRHHKHAHTLSRLEKAVPGQITAITAVGEIDVYDLEVVDDNHSFVADGFVVHNCELKFRIRMPMDAHRQQIRHRMASVNEYSTRYSEAIDAKQKTAPTEWRLQSTTNKQGSGNYLGEEWPEGFHADADGTVRQAVPEKQYDRSWSFAEADISTPGKLLSVLEEEFHKKADDLYQLRLAMGVAREQARKDLPLSTYTEYYWKIDLHNLLHYLSLRLDKHAQLEIRSYAGAIGHIVAELYPVTHQAFLDYRLEALTLSAIEQQIISRMVCLMTGMREELRLTRADVMELLPEEWAKAKNHRERDEFFAKLVQLGFPDFSVIY